MARPVVNLLALIVFVVAQLLWATGAWAKDVRAYEAGPLSSRHRPIKDCTRLNGRYGYYGNPWCSRSEQLRWDRRTARQRARSGKH